MNDDRNGPWEIPRSWTWTQVGEVLDISSGYGFPKRYQGRPDGDLPFFKVADISRAVSSGDIYLRKAEHYVSFDECRVLGAKPAKEGTVVFAKIGEALKLNRRAILNQPSLVDNNVMGLHSLTNEPSPLFAYYYLLTVRLENLSRATTVPSVRKTDVERIPFPLSPSQEQHRIVAKIEELFTKLDAGVEGLKRIKAQLKRYRQAVLKHAFEGKLTKEWREAHKGELEPASVLLERIREERENNVKMRHKELPLLDKSDLPELPEGWMWTSVGEVAESMKNGIYKPRRFYSQDGTACLRMYNIENGSIVWKDVKRMRLTPEEKQEYELKPGDILVNRVNSRELVGKAAPIPLGLEICVYESKNIRLRLLTDHIRSKYVSFWFQVFSRPYFNHNAQQTVGMASINQAQLGAMPVPFCHPTEQQRIVEGIERHLSIADNAEQVVEQGLKQAQKLRQSILKKAFGGKLVPQDPSDEPADRLLERIRQERARLKENDSTAKGKNARQLRLA